MAVTANSIVTPQKPALFTAVATTAETAFYSPTGQVTLVDETVVGTNDNGLRITSLNAIARGAAGSACHCQLYRKQGAAYTLIASAVMPAGSPSGSVASPTADFGYSEDNPLVLAPGVGLAVAIGQTIANGVVFRASGGAY